MRKDSVVDVLTVMGGGGTILPPAAAADAEDDRPVAAAAWCDAFIVVGVCRGLWRKEKKSRKTRLCQSWSRKKKIN